MAIKNQDKNADNAALFFLGPSLFFMAAVPKNNADNTDKSVAIEKRFFIKEIFLQSVAFCISVERSIAANAAATISNAERNVVISKDNVPENISSKIII